MKDYFECFLVVIMYWQNIFITLSLLLVTIVTSKRYCNNELTKFVSMTCGFAGEKTPCLKENANSLLENKCCSNKGCTINDVKKECCWTKSCLDRCYPGKRYNNGEVW